MKKTKTAPAKNNMIKATLVKRRAERLGEENITGIE
jgi:hypothetical protein